MYQTKHIEAFMEKVRKEAEEAAQKVFDKHQAEFDRMVLAQMKPNDYLYVAMGSAVFKGEKRTEAQDKFAHSIAQIQFAPDLHANFEPKDYFSNKHQSDERPTPPEQWAKEALFDFCKEYELIASNARRIEYGEQELLHRVKKYIQNE